jgi:ribosomal protein S18 acetylase RimI-like enzyme
MECAGAAVRTPGRTALLYLPPDVVARRHPEAYDRVLRSLQATLWSQAVVLAQALLPTGSRHTEHVLTGAGFRFLAELAYQERRVDAAPGSTRVRDDLEFVAYADDTHPLFVRALERTYQNSLDCPGLTGLRDTEDVLATHRAAGRHDPNLWYVARAGDEPVGVLLLSQVLRRPALEVVYMGVASSARNQGVGHALLARAADECTARRMSAITLAVDAANQPALHMYQRWGFTEIARRRAWIVTHADDAT